MKRYTVYNTTTNEVLPPIHRKHPHIDGVSMPPDLPADILFLSHDIEFYVSELLFFFSRIEYIFLCFYVLILFNDTHPSKNINIYLSSGLHILNK